MSKQTGSNLIGIAEGSSSAMDDSEKMLLRRRKPHLCETIQLTDEFVDELRNVGLVTSDVIAMINLEKTNALKVSRLVDHLVALKSPSNAFSLFIDTVANDYKWLARDLVADLRVERGEVKPRPEMLEEAAVLVHRRFGTSKRFSETDKKDMSELIAIKLQIADDEWQAEMVKTSEKLTETTQILQGRDRLAQMIYDMERTFVRRHEKQLVTHAHDMTTMREFIEHILEQEAPPGGVNPLSFVKERLDTLFKQMSFALNQYESLYYEKEKSLRLLGVTDPKAALEECIGRITGRTFVDASLETEDKSETIRKLRRRVDDLERQLEQSERKIDGYQLELDERDRDLSKLRRMVQID